MAYVMVVYAMTSFIQIESVWRQRSEGEDPIAFSFLSPLFAVPVNLLYPHHFQIFHGVVRLAEVGRNWLFRLPRPDVGAVSIHPGVQGILRLSNILQNTLLPCYKIDQIFVLHVLLLLMLYCLPVILLLNVLHVCYFLAAFTPFVVASVVAGVGWGGWCGQGRADKEVPQILRPSKGYQRWVGDGLFQLL